MGYAFVFVCGLHVGMCVCAAIFENYLVAMCSAVSAFISGALAAQRIDMDRRRP